MYKRSVDPRESIPARSYSYYPTYYEVSCLAIREAVTDDIKIFLSERRRRRTVNTLRHSEESANVSIRRKPTVIELCHVWSILEVVIETGLVWSVPGGFSCPEKVLIWYINEV